MKIGVLTFHRPLNYGALLQAYALLTVLNKLGADAEIIDYRNLFLEKLYAYPGYLEQRGLRNKLRYILFSRREKEKRKKFETFRTDYLRLKCAPKYRHDGLISCNSTYDCFIVGSDQVWSPNAHRLDGSFFLDFVDDSSRKFSYAASFGVSDIPECFYGLYRQWLEGFAMISVREAQGSRIVSSICPDAVPRMDVDPVLLLTKLEWMELMDLHQAKEKYVFVYSFGVTDNQKRMIRECYSNGLKVVVEGRGHSRNIGVPCTYIDTLDPREFLQTLYSASYVVTNSFHGTALSILFEKPFSMEYLPDTKNGVNSRLENIISITGLESCVLSNETNAAAQMRMSIDWKRVHGQLDFFRQDSICYLKKVIAGEYTNCR